MLGFKRLALATAAFVGSAHAACAEEARQGYNIAPQPLSAALNEFGVQSGRSVLFSSEVAAERRARSLVGAYTPEEALQRLLDGTGLTYRRSEARTFLIQESGGEPSRQSGPIQPSDVVQSTERTSVDELVVTGSRIARRDYNSNTPIVTLQEEQLENTSSFALETKLNLLPQFNGSINSQFGTTTFNGKGGQSTLDFRHLNDNRNLVLLDGRRLMPSNGTFAIDINTIPASVIGAVEIISGGASAVYGSDAISGVVNFKLRDDVDGFEIQSLYGASERGDNQTYNVSLLGGGDFAGDRGNAFFAVEWAKREPVFMRDVDFFREGFAAGTAVGSLQFLGTGFYQPGGALGSPSQAAVDAYFSQFGAAPGAVGATGLIGFNNDATSLFNVQGPAIYNYRSGVFPDNGLYTVFTGTNVRQNLLYDTYASLPAERYSMFGGATYDISPDLSAFVQGYYTNYTSISKGFPSPALNFWPATVPGDFGPGGTHPVPAPLATLLASRNGGAGEGVSWVLGKTLTFMGPVTLEHENDVWQLTAGLRGDLPIRDWTWELYGSEGRAKVLDVGTSGYVNYQRYQQLITAPFYGRSFTDPTTGMTCTSGVVPFGDNALTSGAFTSGGVTLNQSVSADCRTFLEVYPKSETEMLQRIVELSAQGGLFEAPGGEVRFAAGASYRKNTFEFSPDFLFTPLANGFTAFLVGQSGLRPTEGSTSVTDIYAEVLVPLLADLPLIHKLELDGAYRYSDYELSGGTDTYKLDGTWEIVEGLSLRAGYQRAVRAPNVVELFAPRRNVTSSPAFDPCQSNLPNVPYSNTPSNPNRTAVQTLCRALMGAGAPTITDPVNDPRGLNTYVGSNAASLLASPGGNPNLDPEVADTITLGLVFQPNVTLPLDARVTATIDYYSIEVAGAIASVTGAQAYQLCFNANGTSNPTYDPANLFCRDITRLPSNGGPASVNNMNENIAAIETAGVDAQFNIDIAVPFGRLNVNEHVSYLDSFETSPAPTVPAVDLASHGGGYFRWRNTLTAIYDLGEASAGMRWRWLSSVRDASCTVFPGGVCPAGGTPDTEAYSLFDLFGAVQLNDQYRIHFGVDNVADRDPPVVGGLIGNTDPGNYDILGRRYYVGLKIKL